MKYGPVVPHRDFSVTETMRQDVRLDRPNALCSVTESSPERVECRTAHVEDRHARITERDECARERRRSSPHIDDNVPGRRNRRDEPKRRLRSFLKPAHLFRTAPRPGVVPVGPSIHDPA